MRVDLTDQEHDEILIARWPWEMRVGSVNAADTSFTAEQLAMVVGGTASITELALKVGGRDDALRGSPRVEARSAVRPRQPRIRVQTPSYGTLLPCMAGRSRCWWNRGDW